MAAHKEQKEANMRQKQKERDAMTQPKTDLAYLRNEKAKAEQKLHRTLCKFSMTLNVSSDKKRPAGTRSLH